MAAGGDPAAPANSAASAGVASEAAASVRILRSRLGTALARGVLVDVDPGARQRVVVELRLGPRVLGRATVAQRARVRIRLDASARRLLTRRRAATLRAVARAGRDTVAVSAPMRLRR